MPTYEYKCHQCGHRFEQDQRITAEALKECPECKGAVQRLISKSVGISFKGSGFYVTDSKKAASACKSCAKHKSCANNSKA
jgi:putative FmdB family regulatory protein